MLKIITGFLFPVLIAMASLGASSLPPTIPDYYNVVAQGGMVGDGTTDNAAAFTNACAFAVTNNRTVFIPDGIFKVNSATTCNANVQMTDNAILQAGTPGMAWVVAVGDTTTLVTDKFWRGGIIDAHNNANDGIYIRYAAHYDMTGVYVSDQVNNAWNVGDPGTANASYEVHLSNVHSNRANGYWDSGLSCTIPSTSVGVYWNHVTDSRLDLAEFVSSNIGVWTNTGSIINSRVHPWPRTSCGNMAVAFKDSGVGNTYIADHADTPSQYGFWFNSSNPESALISPRFTMNSTLLTSAIGVYYSQTAYPIGSIYDAQFGDASSGGGFATDFNSTIGFGIASSAITGTHYYPSTAVKNTKYLTNNNVPGFSPTCIHGATNTVVLFGSVSSTYTVPSCFTSLTKIETIGAGGSVAAGNTIGGAGGGAYSAITTDANFVANAVLNFQLGLPGGTQGSGSGASGTADTWFDSNTVLLAQGGQSTATSTGGLGGATASGVGTSKNAGGAGGTSFSGGSGGGGAGGPGGVGGAGGAGASSKGGGGGGGAGTTAVGSAGAGGATGIGGAGGATGGGQGGQGWQSVGVPAAFGYLPVAYSITTYGGSNGPGGGGGGGGGGTGQAATAGQTCGGGGGGSGTLGSGTAIRAGGGGCIIITYVQ